MSVRQGLGRLWIVNRRKCGILRVGLVRQHMVADGPLRRRSALLFFSMLPGSGKCTDTLLRGVSSKVLHLLPVPLRRETKPKQNPLPNNLTNSGLLSRKARVLTYKAIQTAKLSASLPRSSSYLPACGASLTRVNKSRVKVVCYQGLGRMFPQRCQCIDV